MANDRRESYRCQLPGSEPPGILRTGKKDYVVQLCEESAGGFTALATGHLPVKVGQIISLVTGAGCTEVRVVHVTDQGDHCRIGLQRVRELFTLGKWSWRSLRSVLPTRADTVFQLTVVVGLCFVFFLWGSRQSTSGTWLNRVTRPFSGNEPVSRQIHEARRNESKAANEKALATNYLRLDQLNSPQFVKQLGLTNAQQQQVGAILQETTRALSKLYEHREQLAHEEWSEFGLRVMHTSWEEILSVMSDEQRARWKALAAHVSGVEPTETQPSAS